MTRAWTATTRRRVRDLLGALVECADAWGPESSFPFSVAKGARAVLPLLAERKAPAKRLGGKSRAEARAERREHRRTKRAEIRSECMKRSRGFCEHCNAYAPNQLHMDHFWGRAREESLESCWMLCWRCHDAKTNNSPTRVDWLRRFFDHCSKHNYGEQMAKVNMAEFGSGARRDERGRER